MRLLLLCCALLLASCQTLQPLPPLPVWQSPEGLEHAQLGLIRDLHTGATLTPQQLVDRLAAAPRVLVGEQHDNPDQHALQLWLLQALSQRRAQGSVLLEMLTPSQQGRVRQLQAVPVQLADASLASQLAWQPGWDWSLYGPIVRYALAEQGPLLAANLDRAEVMRIYAERPLLQGQWSTASRVSTALLEQIRQSHCGVLPEAQLPAMLAVQQQRDRRMAEALQAAPTPALLIAGAFHVRRDLGVPLHLHDLDAQQAPPLVLMLAEVGQPPLSAASADFVWYSAALPAQDHCAEFLKK